MAAKIKCPECEHVCDSGNTYCCACGYNLYSMPARRSSSELACSEWMGGFAVLAEEARKLCWSIEKLPASEQQTECSIMASELAHKLYQRSQPPIEKLSDGYRRESYENTKNREVWQRQRGSERR